MIQPYSFWITLRKSAIHFAIVTGAAIAVALGNMLLDPAAAGFTLPQDKLWLIPILSAMGQGLLNWAKNAGKGTP